MFSHSIAVLHDKGKLTLISSQALQPKLSASGLTRCAEVMNNSKNQKPISLPGGACITSIIGTGPFLFLVADSEQVYVSSAIEETNTRARHIDYVIDHKQIRKIEFFEENPIAVNDSSMHIRSAGNAI